jgi:hypothetical protein
MKCYLREKDAAILSDYYRKLEGLDRFRIRFLVVDDFGLGFRDGQIVAAKTE